MKKLVSKAPGGRKVVINLFETPVPLGGGKSAAEYRALLQKERDYDAHLDRMATEISALLDVAEAGENAIDYWRAGRLMADFQRDLEMRVAEAGEEQRYEQKGRTWKRVEEKVGELRREKKLPKERYSVNYFRKFVRFATLMTERQAARPVPYTLQHELLYSELTEADRDSFLDRCESGELGTSDALRNAVSNLRDARRADVPPRGQS